MSERAIDLSIFEPPPDLTPAEVERFNRTWSDPRHLIGRLSTVNNIPVAQRYMIAGFIFFLVGGVLGILMRIQLGTPENTFLDAETYNQIFTMHGTTMMFLFVIPFIEALANYMLPLLLGTRDMPFPRLTALSFWTYVFGGVFLYSSFIFGLAPNGGWFSYVPLNNVEFSPGLNMDFWDIGLSVAEIAAMGAAAEIIVAILRMRAPGMSLVRMPLFCWAMLVTAFMIIFAFTPLIVGTALLELDRKGLTSFFKPGTGGDPLLWQHLFWVFAHPEVYIMFLPAAGIVSQIVQTFSRRPIIGYPLMVVALVATGFISFGLWVHHMFAAGVAGAATTFFTASSLVIAIPAGVQVFSWVTTLWAGRPVWRTPLLFVAGFLFIFTIGGLTGVMLAAVPFDQQAHDSFFVVAHFHYVLIGGVVFPLFAALYYWLPKMTGRMLSERLGRWNFALMFSFFNITFFPMHISGLLGMPRRIYTYPSGLGWDTYNLISSIGALGFALGILLFIVNFFRSLRRGEPAGHDPWQGDTLEWSQTSPPAQAQFQMVPSVRGRHPLWQQNDLNTIDAEQAGRLRQLNWRPLDWRGALIVSVLDGEPRAIVHVPSSTIWPFVMSVGFVGIFAALLLDHLLLFAAGAAISLVALGGWFWPQPTERRALEEVAGEANALPLAIGRPDANGYWGAFVLLLVLATALVTLIATYFYLEPAVMPATARTPVGWSAPALMSIGFAAIAALIAWVRSAIGRDPRTSGRFALTTAFLINIAAIWLLLRAYVDTGVQPAASAYGSAVAALLGFQILTAILVGAMTLIALLWAYLKPADVRGHAVVYNLSVIAYFAAASALLVMLTVYASPSGWW
ncbi:MAG: cytochrome c oxidase subunit I [Gemmatimonadota bacterium]